ncbi:MAG: efflux RND transporter periplasmic adaptor subunit [Treponema sp.]|jgi:HlyD family secretion protein|nr:efflux RND transporter periplasmic adaptor subunit [Treponema sp.]
MPRQSFPFLSRLVLWGVICLSFAGCRKPGEGATTYEYTEIRRGALEKTVSASGTLKPVATVSVLARMSGKVETIHVDYNDRISRGEILAELNTDMLKLQREQQLASVVKARANYELQFLNFQNQQMLAERNLISDYELRTARTSLSIQAAELSAAEASLRVIETEINQYALITSPIDGIVLERNINEGSTVVEGSSSNSSSIFTLAENLEEMQIEAAVGELDIAGISAGQEVRFTLEALPGRTYAGAVETVHLMPTVQDSVVSYTVIINVDNQDGSLLPGMTCAVEFIEERNENILIVPNGALRYQPSALSAQEIAGRIFNAGLRGMSEAQRAEAVTARAPGDSGQSPETRQQGGGLSSLMMGGGGFGAPGAPPMPGAGPSPGGGPPGSGGGGRSAGGSRPAQSGAGSSGQGQSAGQAPKALWYMNGEGKLECILVRTGISDGSFTEIRPLPRRGGETAASGEAAPEAAPEAALEGLRVILRERV